MCDYFNEVWMFGELMYCYGMIVLVDGYLTDSNRFAFAGARGSCKNIGSWDNGIDFILADLEEEFRLFAVPLSKLRPTGRKLGDDGRRNLFSSVNSYCESSVNKNALVMPRKNQKLLK